MDKTKIKPNKIWNSLYLIAIALLIFIGGAYAGEAGVLPNIVQNGSNQAHGVDLSLYNNILGLINTQYYDKNPNDSSLFYASVSGMVSSLGDPATLFLNPTEETSFEQASSGDTFAGIGVALAYNSAGKIVVEQVLAGGSAATSGLLNVGDEIDSINGTSVGTDSITDVTNLIRGASGTDISLGITQGKTGDATTITLERQPVHVASVLVSQLTDASGNKVDELSVTRFTDDSLSDWEANWDSAVQTIQSDNPKGLIIDLRDNPGGFFNAAIYALSDFLPKNTVGAMQEARGGQITKYYTQTTPRLSNIKVQILVNSNTASAAEIFSGAMQYYKRATIIGADTYGKGTAQQVFTFPDGSALHLTTDHWLLPSGRWIQKSDPIHPDIQITDTAQDFMQGQDPQLAAGLANL